MNMSKKRIASLHPLFDDLYELGEKLEEKTHQSDILARMNGAIAGLTRSEQQGLRDVLTKHINDTYDGADE